MEGRFFCSAIFALLRKSSIKRTNLASNRQRNWWRKAPTTDSIFDFLK
jgi:hypothetical protein